MDPQSAPQLRCLKTADIQQGMLLHSDVADRSGRVLLRAGAVLESKHKKIFQTWGIMEVAIVTTSTLTADKEVEAIIDPATLEAATTLTERRFIKTEQEHPAVKELFNLTLSRLAKELSGDAPDGH